MRRLRRRQLGSAWYGSSLCPIIARMLGGFQANFVSLEPCEGPGGGESAEALQALARGWTGISAWPDAKALGPARRRTLRGASHTAAVAVVLLQKSILDLRVDFVEPLFSAVSFILINPNLSR
jgi:hypothetical protein